MDNIKDLIISFLNNGNYVNFISIFVVALTSYQVARFNASRPNKLKVKQAQLDFVYLPLYRTLIDLPRSVDKKKALAIHKKISSILDQHYELAFPQLHSLNKQLKEALLSNSDYSKILHTIFHQVSVDYEMLKKALGYPSENIFSIFIRMTTKQKLLAIISYVNMFSIFSFVFLLPTAGPEAAMLCAFVTPLLLLFINRKIQKMKD